MRIDRGLIDDPLLYDVMYFSPVEVGEERYFNSLYFDTETYKHQWPTLIADQMSKQIDHLRQVEVGLHPYDEAFRQKHRAALVYFLKMALAYLDLREARIAMKLCELGEPATQSTEPLIAQDPYLDMDFLRVVMLSLQACAARRVKQTQKAIDALTEAKDICLQEGERNRLHPLLTALTLLNLSSVLGDSDRNEEGLRWGLQALSMMYACFSDSTFPEEAGAFYFTLACHNGALLSLRLQRWSDAVELVNEGVEFTKVLGEGEDGLRAKMLALGALAKGVPEGFLTEAVNALNGWGEEKDVWNLSFWDWKRPEIKEEIHVLKHTSSLKQLIIEHFELSEQNFSSTAEEDECIAQLALAMIMCKSLEAVTIAGVEFNPKQVWQKVAHPTFLETSFYSTPLSFQNILHNKHWAPDKADYVGVLKDFTYYPKKLVLSLIILGNQSQAVDLSGNRIDEGCVTTIVHGLKRPDRPSHTREVASLILRGNDLNGKSAAELAKAWMEGPDVGETTQKPKATAGDQDAFGFCLSDGLTEIGVTLLDVSHNSNIGNEGLEALTAGLAHFENFKVLIADTIGLGSEGCAALHALSSTHLQKLCLSRNCILSAGAEVVCQAMLKCKQLRNLQLESCGVDGAAAKALGELLGTHPTLRDVGLSRNSLGSEGAVHFFQGAAGSPALRCLQVAYNEITSEAAAQAIGQLMRRCETLLELDLSGNEITPEATPHIGAAIEHSSVVKLQVEHMKLDEDSIDKFLDHGAAEAQDLQILVLSNNPVGDEGLATISECLSIGLAELGLSRCELTATSQSTLLNMISLQPNLKKLDLSHNDLGPYACETMVAWMIQNGKENYALRHLELGFCGLRDEGLAQLLPVLDSLVHLGVGGNGITCAGITAVMRSPQLIQLKVLDLSDNDIREAGVYAITERFQEENKKGLWNPKQLTSTIDQVVLSGNPISKALAGSTEAFLKVHNPLLSIVW